MSLIIIFILFVFACCDLPNVKLPPGAIFRLSNCKNNLASYFLICLLEKDQI
jgi:hypothetical protein